VNEEYLDPDSASDLWGGATDPDGYQVLALDPGGTTGWAVLCVHPEAMEGDPDVPVMSNIEWWTAGEFTGSSLSQCDEIVELAHSWPSARLVTEGFKLRQLNAELDPVEINHTVAWALRPRYFVQQQPALAMSTVTDDRQKEWGFWVPGKPHARDAVKHGITFLKRQKERAVQALRQVRRAS
jgi:hypothetical protein